MVYRPAFKTIMYHSWPYQNNLIYTSNYARSVERQILHGNFVIKQINPERKMDIFSKWIILVFKILNKILNIKY